MFSLILISAYLGFLVLATWLSYFLGQSKTENPRVAALIGFLLALFPPFGLIYLAILALKEDVGTV